MKLSSEEEQKNQEEDSDEIIEPIPFGRQMTLSQRLSELQRGLKIKKLGSDSSNQSRKFMIRPEEGLEKRLQERKREEQEV